MHRTRRTAALALVLGGTLFASACGGGGGFEEEGASSAPASAKGPAALKMLIASSGDAETNAVKAATDAWAKKTGNKVTVTVASDMHQQLAQGFASGNPADVVLHGRRAASPTTPSNGSLYPYADQISDNNDFYESLRQTFTYEGKQYCIPKDFSTLALQINTDSWTKAGLTDADVPTTWDQLEAVSKKLTTKDQAGPGHRRRHRPARRLRGAERRLVAQGRRQSAAAANSPEVTEALE